MKITFKTLAIATSLCTALVLSPVSFAGCDNSGNQGGQGKGYHQSSEKRLAKMTRKLDLTESQQAEIKVLHADAKAQKIALTPAKQAYRQQVKTLMSADIFDEQAFIELQASNQDVSAAMALIKAKTMFAVKGVLTEEQLVKFNTMKHKGKKSRK